MRQNKWVKCVEALPGEIPISDMTQRVATECKMKSRQETTSISQIATVMAKPRISVGQRTLDCLIYRQSECQEEVIFINFP